ncbi:hypothetical protein [Parvibaculum sp.]|uniref:hypothetical protein n=1 Tax=Parvibaculum sp. TaxID=2024848 RepID=UPI003C77788E
MPTWLQWVSHFNPLTYEVDGLRTLMLEGGESAFGLGADALILCTTLAILVFIGRRMYPRLAT